jgi:hypothetical protein
MKIIVDIISSVLEVLVLYYFFKHVLVKERHSAGFRIFTILLCITLFTLVSTISSISSYASALNLLVLLLYPFLFYKDKFIKKILYSFVIYIFGIMSEIIVGVVLTSLYHISIQDSITNIYIFLQCMIISKLVQFFILRIIGFFKINNKIEINIRSLLAFLIIPTVGIVSIYYFSMVAYLSSNLISKTLLLVLTILTILSNVATFYLLEKQLKLQKSEDMLINLEKQYELQKEYYSELKQNMIITNKNTHDIRNFATAITSYLKNQKIDLAISKIEEFYGKIPAPEKINTGNDAVDALVKTKLKDIEQEIPANKISISFPEKLNIDEIDLCILIGNAIDNAIEACQKISDISNRFIEIRIFPVNDQISMVFKNSKISDGKRKKNKLKTSKENAFSHGFGIENMKNICLKYGGNLSIEQDENRFCVSALLLN